MIIFVWILSNYYYYFQFYNKLLILYNFESYNNKKIILFYKFNKKWSIFFLRKWFLDILMNK